MMNAITANNTTGTDITEAVRSTAVLADVTLSLWGAERTDKKIMDEARVRAGATGNVGRAIKNLLSGADDNLKATRSAFIAIRTAHYGMTLPWVADPHAERQRGPRLLPNALFDRYMTTMGQRKAEATKTLEAFIDSYPADAARARQNLGTMACADDYPDPAEIPRLFRISFNFEPIPAGAHFHGLPDLTIARLTASLEKKQAAMVESARSAMWAEIRDRVERVVERLNDPDTRFKVSTIDNARELAVLVPGWNVTGSAEAEQVARDIGGVLDGIEAKTIREDTQARARVVDGAQAVLDKMAGWGL